MTRRALIVLLYELPLMYTFFIPWILYSTIQQPYSLRTMNIAEASAFHLRHHPTPFPTGRCPHHHNAALQLSFNIPDTKQFRSLANCCSSVEMTDGSTVKLIHPKGRGRCDCLAEQNKVLSLATDQVLYETFMFVILLMCTYIIASTLCVTGTEGLFNVSVCRLIPSTRIL